MITALRDAGMNIVLVAAGQQGGACRGAKRRGIEFVVFDAARRQGVECRRRNGAAEGA